MTDSGRSARHRGSPLRYRLYNNEERDRVVEKSALRPIERRVLDLHEAGMSDEEIAARFKRSPDHIGRIIEFANLPGRRGSTSERGGLRALERRVLRWRAKGLDHREIGKRFRRSPGYIRQVEGLALYKKSLSLLGGSS